MIVPLMWRFLVLAVVFIAALPNDDSIHGTGALLLSDRNPVSRRCRYDKVFGMLQASCADLNLNEMPRTLQKDIQILDFSGNRLRELNNDSLSSFTSLAYLYLMDNFIQSIGEMTFSSLKRLQVLDMTTNGLSDFPKMILTLPQLKKLYLSQNQLSDTVLCSDPSIGDSNLEFLELSRNHLTKLPHLLYLPQLKYLNVSGNSITKIKAEEAAAFCSLEVLDISHNPITFVDSCECRAFNGWIESQKIKMFPPEIKCHSGRRRRQDQHLPRCSSITGDNFISNETLKVFHECKDAMRVREEIVKARNTWIVVASSVGAFLVVLFIILYCIHKRNKKKKLQSPTKDSSYHGADELLNANNTCERT